MSTVIKNCVVNGFYICLEIKFEGTASYYNVEVCIKQSNNTCSYPINCMVYSINEKAKAYRTYNRYVNKYSAWEG